MGWEALLVALTAAVTAVGGALAAWNAWGKQRGDTKKNHGQMTLDGVFKLVNELQEEVAAKDTRYTRLETQCTTRIEALEARIVVHEQAFARHTETIADLRRDLRAVKEGIEE